MSPLIYSSFSLFFTFSFIELLLVRLIFACIATVLFGFFFSLKLQKAPTNSQMVETKWHNLWKFMWVVRFQFSREKWRNRRKKLKSQKKERKIERKDYALFRSTFFPVRVFFLNNLKISNYEPLKYSYLSISRNENSSQHYLDTTEKAKKKLIYIFMSEKKNHSTRSHRRKVKF